MRAPKLLALAVLLAVGSTLAAGAAERPSENETFQYRWRLHGLASLFLPGGGEGTMKLIWEGDALRCELVITSRQSGSKDHFRYAAEIDPERRLTLHAWSSYLWRGKQRAKESALGKAGLIDIASAIYWLRREPPKRPARMDIWSDGKVYPVVVIPMGVERRQLPGGVVIARHFSVRGVQVRDRPFWKGRLELWFSADEQATPVEIQVERSFARLRLELVRAS